MGEMKTMGKQGDTKIIWDRNNATEVEAARAHFDTMRSRGCLAFSVTRTGDKGEQITAFDPAAEKIILAPQIRGGC